MTLKYDNGQGNGNGGVGSNVDNANSSTSQYYAKVVTWNENTNTIESNDPEIEGSKTTTYSMTPTIVNYVELTKGYTMPFDYLWSLLVMSENKDFVLKLADLVYNSEIEITVHDNLEIDTNVVVDKYTKKERVDTDGMATVVSYTKADTSVKNTTRANEGQSETPKTNTVSKTGEWSDEESKSYVVTNTTVNKKNTINYKLTKANVWLENYTQEYTYQTPKTTTTTNTVKLEDENYGDSPDSTSNEDTYGHMKELFENLKKSVIAQNNNSQNISIDGQINYINTKVYHATVDKSKETTDTTETKQYVESPAKIQEKTDPKSKEPNFVTLYLENTNEKGRSNISSASSWLFEILENNTSTQDMVDLTKYLLYKATKKDYGVKEYDFSVYSPSELSDMDNGGQSNIEGVPGQIADFFLKKGMPIEGVAAILGNIEQECGFDASAISSPDYYGGYHGLCQWGNYQGSKDGRFAQLEKLAKKKGKDWKDVDVQIEFIWQELNGSGYKSVKDKLMNGKDVNQTTEFFAREYEKCINADGSIQQLDKRQNYANKWLKELKQKATGDSTNIDTSSFLSTAKSCHDYLRINQYWYPTSANLAAGRFVSDNGMPQTHKFPTRGEAVKDRYVDCSAYVSWVLKEYGYNISYPYTASMLNNNPLNLISVPISDVKAGDILVRSNHTEIYCGNGKAYSCGSTSAIREEYSNCNPSGFTNAYRVNKTK